MSEPSGVDAQLGKGKLARDVVGPVGHGRHHLADEVAAFGRLPAADDARYPWHWANRLSIGWRPLHRAAAGKEIVGCRISA
jgi:hypothetical protein